MQQIIKKHFVTCLGTMILLTFFCPLHLLYSRVDASGWNELQLTKSGLKKGQVNIIRKIRNGVIGISQPAIWFMGNGLRLELYHSLSGSSRNLSIKRGCNCFQCYLLCCLVILFLSCFIFWAQNQLGRIPTSGVIAGGSLLVPCD